MNGDDDNDGVNRSGQPSELNFPFLEKLRLNSIVWLAPEDPSPRFQNWMDDQEIRLYHLGVENSVGYDPITYVPPSLPRRVVKY